MSAQRRTTLMLTLDGPRVRENKLPLSELERVSRELRLSVKDIAVVLSQSGPSGRGGRVKKWIEQTTDLEVVAQPRAGSFQLEMEVPEKPVEDAEELPADFGAHVADEAVHALVAGIGKLDAGAEELPLGFDRGVLTHLSRLGPTLKGGVESINLRANGAAKPDKAAITAEKVSAIRSLVRRPVRAQAVIEGILQMVDFASLECRIDRPPHPSVRCFVQEKDRELVFEATRQYVRVAGTGMFEPGQADPSRMDVESLSIVYEELPFDAQAFRESWSPPLQAHGKAATVSKELGSTLDDPWRDDDEARALIAAIKEG